MWVMTRDTDILIIGGSLTGTTMAQAATKAGFRVIMLDQTELSVTADPAFDGRSYAVALASQRLLQGVGLWDDLAEVAEPILGIKVSDGRVGEAPSRNHMHFDHAELGRDPMGYMVEDRHLRAVLQDAVLQNDEIDYRPGTKVIGQRTEGETVLVTLDDGSELSAALLLGADGRQGGTAERAGLKKIGWSYTQTALVCAISHERPLNGTAHQLFLPAGPLAILPLRDNHASIVWSEEKRAAQAIQELDDASYLDALRLRLGDFLGDINLRGARYTYPLSLNLAQSLVADRCALVGDAAHGVHPIAGQGLNAGFRDIAAMADVLNEARKRGEDIGNALVLERYQTWRRFDATALALATDRFNALFSNDNSALRMVRSLGMGAINALPKLKKGFIREAAGLTGDLPSLMQGRPFP